MITDIFNNCLTVAPMLDNLSALSTHWAVRFCSRKNQQMPVKARLIYRLRYSMQKIIYGGRYLGSFGSHGSVAMSANPNNVHRPIFCRIKRCSLTFNRDHAMPQNNSVQQTNTQAQAEQHHPNIVADNLARPLLLEWVSDNQEED
jgi:hypothetical protein